jgi:hypothetical protein
METIEVNVRYDTKGRPVPVTITWEGNTYRVEFLGRRWSDEQGEHILVMLTGRKVVHLLRTPAGDWLQVPIRGSVHPA